LSTIDRIRYYDGEFLRAFDFSDEQTYHMEMRRRLNRYLHLYGIVQGLNLVSPSGSTDVSIMPGMAIDAFGREIYVFAPYTLGDSDITNSRVTSGGQYGVWLRYQKTPSTPPSSGYGICNQANQYTRWLESFSVSLQPSSWKPPALPEFATDDTDDPSQDQIGVLLGTVSIDLTTGMFSNPQLDPQCKLLGMIVQRIQTPYDATQATPPFNFWNQNPAGIENTPLSPLASLEIEPNIFADQNLVVGQDFPLTSTPTTTISITPNAVTSPGNVKIAGDLFVQGNIYSPTVPSPGTQQWNGIDTNVKQLLQSGMPDFVASQPVQVSVPNPAPSITSFTVTAPSITIPSKLSAMDHVVASAAISGIQLNAGVTFGASVGVFITTVSGSPGIGQCTVSVTYTVTGVPASHVTPILTFNVTATAVCFPP
jgi:hypothetical protein